MVTTLCSAADVVLKQGSGISASGANTSNIELWIMQAEAYISARLRYDFVSNYSSMGSTVKQLLRLIVSNLATIWSIQFDMSGYTTRLEAETMLDVLYDQIENAIRALDNELGREYLGVI